jgi:AraC-like DNA-binding protein
LDWDSDFILSRASHDEGVTTETLANRAFKQAPNEVPSPDFGMFREVLNSHYYPAKVERLSRDEFLLAPRLSAVELPHLTIGYVRFGTEASVDPGDLVAYHVNVPLQGTVVSVCGEQKAVASPGMAAVFSPRRHTYLPRWGAGAAQLCIKLDRNTVEQELAALMGRPVVKPIDFRLGLPIDKGPGKRWLGLLGSLLEYVDSHPTAGRASARHLELLEQSLISGLLLAQLHSYTDDLGDGAGSTAQQSSLDRVIETVTSSPEDLYSLTDLSRLASLSARGLQYAFQERFGVSPMQFVRQVRLDRAFKELSNGTRPVADVAYRLGFSNLGRFARAYQARFGELPSDTVAAARPIRRR